MEKDDTFCFFIFKINYNFHIPDLFQISEFIVKQAFIIECVFHLWYVLNSKFNCYVLVLRLLYHIYPNIYIFI